jgi:UDP-N-acetylmuramate--alanine ligase
MRDFKNIEGIYFVGIGGIGMSALAFYFIKGGYYVAGYDRSAGSITHSLNDLGCEVSTEDNIDKIPSFFREFDNRTKVLIIYTPAIPSTNRIISFFLDNDYTLVKRAEVLGEISHHTDTIAVAGTHGKTTISTMIAHLLKQS